MRVESAVTSVSWIPSEAVAGLAKMGFTAGAVRYDDPPPDRIGRAGITFQPAEFPELRADPEVRGGEAVFVQTAGGRTGMPYPRPVRGRPFAQWTAPTVWTTLR